MLKVKKLGKGYYLYLFSLHRSQSQLTVCVTVMDLLPKEKSEISIIVISDVFWSDGSLHTRRYNALLVVPADHVEIQKTTFSVRTKCTCII